MSTAQLTAGPPPVEIEARLFGASPFGTWGTTALIFALCVGVFLLVSALSGYPLISATGVSITRLAPGLVSPLLLATALGANRYADTRYLAELPEFSAVVASGSAHLLGPPSYQHRLLASGVGAVIGVVVAYLGLSVAVMRGYPAVYAWQGGLIVVLCMLFTRGAVMTARTWRKLQDVINHALRIDLLHVDKLSVIGRQTARQALIWFSTAAVVCLYFVGGDSGVTTIPILIGCTGLGLWIFFHPMTGVHRRIKIAKSAELDRVRDQIEHASRDEATDPHAAARLPGLIAYEARIQAVREWPFDQSTLIRVASYVLIPAIPWFGEAIVSDALQRLAH